MMINVPDVRLLEDQTDTDRDHTIAIQGDDQEVPIENDQNLLKNHVRIERRTKVRKRRNRKRMRKSLRDAQSKYCC